MLGVRSLWSRPLATACGRNLWRLQAAPMSSAALTFASHGQPQDVLQLQQPQLPPLGNSSVHIQMLMVRPVYAWPRHLPHPHVAP